VPSSLNTAQSGAPSTPTGTADMTPGATPQRADWRIVRPNPQWKGKISVTDEGATTTVSANLTACCDDPAKVAAKQVTKAWGDAKGAVDGRTYIGHITMTATDDDTQADWHIHVNTSQEQLAHERAIRMKEGQTSAAYGLDFGDSKVFVSPKRDPWNGEWRDSDTLAHEFGHSAGSSHAPEGSGSIMSYDRGRQVLGQDLKNLADAYRAP